MQEITITVRFKVNHNPNTQPHLEQVAKAYLLGKGVVLNDDLVIEV